MIVDMEKYLQACKYINEVDSIPINELKIADNGRIIDVPEAAIEEYKFMGLGAWFITNCIIEEWSLK